MAAGDGAVPLPVVDAGAVAFPVLVPDAGAFNASLAAGAGLAGDAARLRS